MSLARAHDQLVGRSLGDFVLRERIGEGGFGAVYRATQPALDREAVIKVLHSKLHASQPASERFLREAKLASKLDHPYAAHIYAFGAEPDGELWIAMEYVRGTPLDQILKIQGPLPLERFVALLDRVCEVVHTAHEQGIVHRDLKPANVMVLARAGRLLPKLLDFGIAKGLAGEHDPVTEDTMQHVPAEPAHPTANTIDLASATPTPATQKSFELTQRGAIMGSPPYMAPEQWVDAGHVDARTDLYALGILAFECLTGKPPFVGTTMTDVARAHARQPVPALGARFPAALDKVLAKALAKRPEDRYADALAFAAAFRHASGIAAEAIQLPALDSARRDSALRDAPQPIAEAIAALEAARNPHQARDAIVHVARTITRYLGLVALACRSRVAADEPAAVLEAIRTLYRRPLADTEWLELARMLTRTWLDRRDAYPIPELVDAFHERAVGDGLDVLLTIRDRETASDDALLELLERSVTRLGILLDQLGELFRDYSLVVPVGGGIAERWTGVRRPQRTTIAVRGKGLTTGLPALLAGDGTPVLTLAPLFQVTAPAPGSPLDLFLFEGRDGRGAKLVALPASFEHHDDGVWDWFRGQISGSLDETEAHVAVEKAPYRGLQAFSAEDGATFFGREKLVDAFVNRLQITPLLAVVGRSGAGKSSFVQAGVLPALHDRWRAITMRPGALPLAALLARLEHAGISALSRADLERDRDVLGARLRSDAARHGSIVLVIDQLEEMFTLCNDADERRVFAEAIAAAARTAEDPVRVIFTLRDDFLVRTEQVPALRNRIAQGLQLVTVPGSEDLLRIVVEPARRAGYELEGDLAEEMVEEVADQPGALALISFAAAKLWELRDRHFKQLTRAAYKTLGGVGGALAKHADVTLDEMPQEERALAREAFRHLVTSQSTRAVLARKDLRQLLGNSEHADRVIEKLVEARLLVASENESGAETIEIVHEALLVAWPRLVEWHREDVEGARFREQLRGAAAQWQERSRARGLLWRDDALADFTRWRARHAGPLTDLEGAFADASLAEASRGRRNRRLMLASAFAALVAVVVGLVVFNTRIAGQRRELHDRLQQQLEDQGRRLVLEGDPLQALAYLAKAGELGAQGWAHDFLVAQAVRATDGALFSMHHDQFVHAARFSHDGTRVVTSSFDHTAKIWSSRTGELLATHPDDGPVLGSVFTPDDRAVLTATTTGGATLWNSATGAVIRREQHTGAVWCATFSHDGKLAATGGADWIAIWDTTRGDERHRWATTATRTCSFSPDGAWLAAGDEHGVTRVWDVATGQQVHELSRGADPIVDVAFAPDSTRVVTASEDRTAVEWDAATGKALYVLEHAAIVNSARFSPDGKQIVTASNDRTAVVWDADTGVKLRTLTGHHSDVETAIYSPDGRYIATASEDATAWLWLATTGAPVARWRNHRDTLSDVAFDPSGHYIVTASADGTAMVFAAEPQQHAVPLLGHRGGIWAMAFSPDGRRIVTAGRDGIARISDAATGQELAVLRGHTGGLTTVSFSPDGRSIATGGEDGTVRVWDADHPSPAQILATEKTWITQVVWSPDGHAVVASGSDGSLRSWEATSRRLRFERDDKTFVGSVSYEPSGRRIVTASGERSVRFWDADGNLLSEQPRAVLSVSFDASGQRILSGLHTRSAEIWEPETSHVVELVGHAGGLTSASWSSDGKLVVTTSGDQTARLWDAATGDNLAIFDHLGHATAATFSPDGRRLAIANADGATIVDLARYDGTSSELARLLDCRVPYEIAGDRIEPRRPDPVRCDSLR